jgi:Beta/Gamma crystallin
MVQRLFLVLALFCIALGSASAQVVLFDQPNFAGSKLTVRSADPNLADSDFGSRSMSMRVFGGVWQICSQPGFRGDCQEVPPGEYERFDKRFAHRLNSIRPIGAAPAAAPMPNAAPPPPTVIIQAPPPPPPPPEITSCSVDGTAKCPGCSITCTGPKHAICEQPSDGILDACLENSRCVCQ